MRHRENELANFDVKIDNIGNADDARYELKTFRIGGLLGCTSKTDGKVLSIVDD